MRHLDKLEPMDDALKSQQEKDKAQKFLGNKFAGWTVLASGRDSNFWLCRCDCGVQKEVRGTNLVRGVSTRCASCAKINKADFIGKKYGAWTILSYVGPSKDGKGPTWMCECECGVKKVVIGKNLRSGGSTTCGGTAHKSGDGRSLNRDGYIELYMPSHPRRKNSKHVLEHRFVMEKILGRYLKPTETVHHINGIRDDNRPENLELRMGAHGPGQRVSDNIQVAIKFLEENGYVVSRTTKPR